MDFDFTTLQRQLRADVICFGRTIPVPCTDSGFDLDKWHRCAEFGVLGWPVPSEYGGQGFDPLTTIIALDALGYACRDNGLVFAINNHLWGAVVYLLRHGSAEQRKQWLPALCDGSAVGAQAITEPDAGSDVLSMKTTAVSTAEGYRINGVKTFISNAPVADLFVIFAKTGSGSAQDSLSAFLVPAAAPGLRVVRTINKLGLSGTPMGEIELVDCLVPAEQRIGREGSGFSIFSSTIEWERGFMFASDIGRMQRILEDAVDYANQRHQFGFSIGSFQAVSHKLADMRLNIELARTLIHKIGWLKREGRMALLEAAVGKLFISESLVKAALSALQIYGARGYVLDHGPERELRDAVGGTIYGGTSEIQRNIIAQLSGLIARADAT